MVVPVILTVDRLRAGCRRRGKKMKVVLSVLLVALLVACADLPGKAGGPAVLEKRAEARWELLVQGNLAEAYAYLSPATREVTSLEKYLGSVKPGLWRSGSVSKVVCTVEDVCSVEVDVKYAFKPRGASMMESVRSIKETWRKVAGEWWLVPDE
jgi:hypothetical protein